MHGPSDHDDSGHVHGPGCDHDHDHDHDHAHHHVRAPFVRADPKVGRNDLCTCGSGKKFKKCCGSPA